MRCVDSRECQVSFTGLAAVFRATFQEYRSWAALSTACFVRPFPPQSLASLPVGACAADISDGAETVGRQMDCSSNFLYTAQTLKPTGQTANRLRGAWPLGISLTAVTWVCLRWPVGGIRGQTLGLLLRLAIDAQSSFDRLRREAACNLSRVPVREKCCNPAQCDSSTTLPQAVSTTAHCDLVRVRHPQGSCKGFRDFSFALF